jgi:hypothetical protein
MLTSPSNSLTPLCNLRHHHIPWYTSPPLSNYFKILFSIPHRGLGRCLITMEWSTFELDIETSKRPHVLARTCCNGTVEPASQGPRLPGQQQVAPLSRKGGRHYSRAGGGVTHGLLQELLQGKLGPHNTTPPPPFTILSISFFLV